MTGSHPLDADNTKEVQRITWVGVWVNVVLSALKIVGGILGSSAALIADGIESGTDVVTSLALIAGARVWNRPPDANHPYGHRRLETMMTIAIGGVVFLVGCGIVYEAIQSLRTAQHSHPNLLALGVALLSVLSKEALFHWTRSGGTRIRSMAVVANAWHHRSDAISSVPVVLAVAAAQWFPQYTFLDAIGAIAAAGFILKAGAEIMWPALQELTDQGASEETLRVLRASAESVAGVRSIHDLRTRFVGAAIHVDLHVVVDPQITVLASHRIAVDVAAKLKEEGPHVLDVLVHVDPSPED